MSERIRLAPAEADQQPDTVDELVPRPEILKGEALEARVARAVEAVEFQPTAEVYETVRGFYADHYRLADFLSESLTSQDPAAPVEFDPDTPHVIQQTISRLAEARQGLDQQPDDQAQQKRFLVEAFRATGRLFAESSLGITTIGDDELAIRRQLGNQILDFARRRQMLPLLDARQNPALSSFVDFYSWYAGEIGADEISRRLNDEPPVVDQNGAAVFQAGADGVVWNQIKLTDRSFDAPVKGAVEDFWGDVRHGCRLEFHGSNRMEEIIASGGLRSRLEQIRQTGDYNSDNVREGWGGHHHTNAVKFSEFTPSGEYTRPTDETQSPATIGIPIADIVTIAPYARNAKFATLAGKPEASDRLGAWAETDQITKSIDSGGTEAVGAPPASSIQRAFFASPRLDGQWAPDQYQIPVGGPSEADNQTRVLFTYHKPETPQLAGMPSKAQQTWRNWSWAPPAEARFSQHHLLEPRPEDPDAIAQNLQIVQAAQDAVSQDPRYQNSYVVPLRRGVFSFRPEESDDRNYPLIDRDNTPENYLRQAA